MPESVRPPERVATVPQVRERTAREERKPPVRPSQSARKTPPPAHEPVPNDETHALDVEV